MSSEFPEFKPVFQISELSPSEFRGVQAEASQLFDDYQSLLIPPSLPMEYAGINTNDLSLERWDAPDRLLRNRAEKVLLVVRTSIGSHVYEYTDQESGQRIKSRVSNSFTDGTAEEIVFAHEAADFVYGDVPYHFSFEVDGYSDDTQYPDPLDAYDLYDREYVGKLEMTVSSDSSHDTIAGCLVQSGNPDLDANVVHTFRNWLADAVEIK